MNMFFLILILVVLIVIILIFTTQTKNENNKQNNPNKNNNSLVFDDIRLPRKIEKMDYSSLFQACKVIFDSFKALDYTNKDTSDLDRLEWHTWQVSMLLAFMKVYNKFFVPYNRNLFHSLILELNEKDLDSEIQKIFRKYVNHVNIDKNRDELSKNTIWSAREVSILLYSMMVNRRY